MNAFQPKLRFNEFKDNWNTKKLGEIGLVLNGLTYSPDDISKDGILVLRSSNIKDRRLRFDDNVYVNKENYIAVIENDILICVRNGSRNLIGKNTLITKEVEGSAFGAFMSLYRSEYNNFLIHWFDSDEYIENVNFNLGATINSINGSDLKKFIVPFPSLKEQAKIASFLSSVDEKLNLLIEKKQLLEEYKKGVMQLIFKQKYRFKMDNGDDFVDWEEKTLGEIGDIISGKTPSTSDSELWNGDIQFITPTDIKEGNKYQERTVRYVTNNNKLKILPKNSIVYTCVASIGKMCISKYPSITNQQINSLVINQLNSFEYVYYWLLYITPFIKSTQTNTTLPIINKTDFSKFTIQLPCYKEQIKIANFLSAIDDKIELVSNQIKYTKEYKKGLLQQMFV
jgi:type I restriction enzyme S subunit